MILSKSSKNSYLSMYCDNPVANIAFAKFREHNSLKIQNFPKFSKLVPRDHFSLFYLLIWQILILNLIINSKVRHEVKQILPLSP